MSDGECEDDLLKTLENFGHRFLENFDFGVVDQPAKRRRLTVADSPPNSITENEVLRTEFDDVEWHGIDESAGTHSAVAVVEFSGPQLSAQEISQRSADSLGQKKSFMSSKITRMNDETSKDRPEKLASQSADDDHTNLENDAILHKMIHAKLLSGLLDPETMPNNAHKRKAFEGRVEEIAGSSKIGKGESLVRNMEHVRASKQVREGLKRKKQVRNTAELENSRQLGNYHPSLKRLWDDSKKKGPEKKRERGLGMGVGSFGGGMLRISFDDVRRLQGTTTKSSHVRKRR